MMFHVKHKLMGAAIAALFTCAAHAQTCTIVTDSNPDTFDHELAHCNGWDHAEFAIDVQTPPSLVYDYDGTLWVIIAAEWWGGNIPGPIMQRAQADATIRTSEKSVAELCKKLYAANGYDASRPEMDRLEGCSVRR